MNSCTFFGHKNTPEQAEKILLTNLIDLIENKNVDIFYVGNNGNFDNMVIKNLNFLNLTIRTSNTPWFLPICQRKKLSQDMMT